MYGISWEDAAHYDIVLNLAQISLENAASMLVNISQMPDFQMTPASKKHMEDLRLAATARLRIARDERTHRAAVKVRADSGIVNVTYLPQDAKIADAIPDTCKDLPGMKEIRCTMAMTNLLWIQEEFDPHSELYNQIVEIATKWNAAVELIRSVPDREEPKPPQDAYAESAIETVSASSKDYDGGIEEDVPDTVREENGGLKKTLDELASIGRSGGGRVIYGDPHQFITMLTRNVPYSLVVIGDIFLSKGHAARLRATRDLQSFLNDHIKAPVVTADALGSHYLFGKRDIARTLAYLAGACILYFLVFTNQEPILAFIAQAGWYAESISNTFLSRASWIPKVIVSLAVFLFVPVVAYLYSNVTGALLKLIKME
jgi:hypothetical protein